MKRLWVLLLSLVIFSSTASAYNADFAIYTGSGTWDESIIAFKKVLEWKGLTWDEVSAWDVNHGLLINANYRGLFMPGGWAYNYKKSISDRGDQSIRDFIANGGAYIGMSAGAYYACDNVRWEGTDYPYYLNLFHGDCIGPIPEIAPWPDYTMTTMNMNQAHEINTYEPATEDILYYGEPYFVPHAGQEMQTLATWNVPGGALGDQQPGIIVFNYGVGRVALFGPHPEIEEDSDRDGTAFGDELNDNGSDWPFLWTTLDWLLQQSISEPSELPKGGGGSKGDTFPPSIMWYTDTPDPVSAGTLVLIRSEVTDNVGVTSVNVTILETSYPMTREQTAGATLFYDAFESGTLAGWTLFKASGAQNWANVNLNPFQGTRHAQSQPRSTTEPASIMERTISTVGQQGIKVIYARKLVGLDVADEFKAKWFDGTTWSVLEQTGSASANDANYIVKSFTLPSAADGKATFKIRFECTAGAVSEYCRVDNVNVSSSVIFTNIYRASFSTAGLLPDVYSYVISASDAASNHPVPEGSDFTVI